MHRAKSLLLKLLQLGVHAVDLADGLFHAICHFSFLVNVDAAESDQMLQICVTLADRLDTLRQLFHLSTIHALSLLKLQFDALLNVVDLAQMLLHFLV